MKTSKISVSEAWMDYHPDRNRTVVDHYYISICIRVNEILKDKRFALLFEHFDHISMPELAAYLVSYFEDIISDLGLWRAFRNEHQRLYGKQVPFYDITNDYFEEEINFADVAFLIWYYITCKQDTEAPEENGSLMNPLAPEIILMAENVLAIFEEQYELAPENRSLREFIRIPEDVTDFYDVRYRIQWLFTSSYLFHFMSDLMIFRIKKLNEEFRDWTSKHRNTLFNEIKDDITLAEKSYLLAYKGHEWYAEVLGSKHALYKPLKAIGRKRSDNLVYIGKSSGHINFEHPPTGRKIAITRKSMDDMDEHILPGTVVTIGFVKWMDEWWFSGVMAVWGKGKDFFKEDRSLSSGSLFTDENDEWKNTIQEQYDLFLKFNHGTPIAFFSTFFDTNSYMREYMLQWNFLMRKKLNRPGEENIHPYLPEEIPPAIRDHYKDNCVVFFNKEAGLEFLTSMCQLIPDENNTLYNGKIDPALAMHLVIANDCSCGFVHFALDHYGLKKYLLFPGEKNPRLVPDNLDFLLRL